MTGIEATLVVAAARAALELLAKRRRSPSLKQVAAFEEVLDPLGLSESAIDQQDDAELRDSMRKIENLIEGHRLGRGSDADRAEEAVYLLDRKQYVLERISEQTAQKLVASIDEGVSTGEPITQDRESDLVRALSDATQHLTDLDRQREEIELRRAQAMLDMDVRQRDVEIGRQKSITQQGWFSREVIAGIVGGVLLLTLGVAIVVAMFTGTNVSEIASSAFLVILGYFFGQAAAGRSDSEAKKADGG